MRWPEFWTSSSTPDERSNHDDPTTTTTRSPTPGQVLDGLLSSTSDPDPDPRRPTEPSSPDERPTTIQKSILHGSSSHSSPQLHFSSSNIAPTVLLTGTLFAFYAFYRNYLRRIPDAGNISPKFFRKRSLVGRVTSVGDGDNFRIFHTPGGRLAGWGWAPRRKVPDDKKKLKGQTIHIRLAGIDAPELAHFGRPSQPHSQEALKWLTDYVLDRQVRAYIYKRDQYDRAVATVYLWRGFLRRDVGHQMLRTGLATVYEAKSGAEFGGARLEQRYRNAAWWAKLKRKGIWASAGAGRSKDYESPREYKARYSSSRGDPPLPPPSPPSPAARATGEQ